MFLSELWYKLTLNPKAEEQEENSLEPLSRAVGSMKAGEIVEIEGKSVQLRKLSDQEISKIEKSPKLRLSTLSNMTQMVQPLWRYATSSGMYRLVIDNPNIAALYKSGALKLATLNRNPQLFTTSLMKSNGIAFTPGLAQVSQAAVVVPCFVQIASFALAQYHMVEITSMLERIEYKLNAILSNQDRELEAKLNLCIKQAKELKERIECEMSEATETHFVQWIDFDNRLADLETRAGELIENCRLHIFELKDQFSSMAKNKETIDEGDIKTATKIFERWVKCTRLSVLLAYLRNCREKRDKRKKEEGRITDREDMTRKYDEAYVELSKLNLKATIDNLKEIQQTIDIFSPEIYKKHSMLHDIWCFFSSSARKVAASKQDNLNAWCDNMKAIVDNSGLSSELILKYDDNKLSLVELNTVNRGDDK